MILVLVGGPCDGRKIKWRGTPPLFVDQHVSESAKSWKAQKMAEDIQETVRPSFVARYTLRLHGREIVYEYTGAL